MWQQAWRATRTTRRARTLRHAQLKSRRATWPARKRGKGRTATTVPIASRARHARNVTTSRQKPQGRGLTATRIVKVDNFHERWIDDVSFSDATGFLTGLSVGQLRAVGVQLASQHVPSDYAWRRRFGIDDMPNRAVASTPRPEIQPANVSAEPEAELETRSETLSEAVTVPPEGQDGVPLAEPAPATDSRPEPQDQSATDQEEVEPAPNPRKHGAKASVLVTVIEGISERILPDGRIAFLVQPGTPADEQLTGVCKGRVIWNPRFRNWLCSAERAEEIRHALGTQPAGERT